MNPHLSIGTTADPVVTAIGSELIQNPGFETAGGGGVDIWANWFEVAADGALANETTIVHSGNAAAKLTSGATVGTYIYQNVTVVAGRMYHLRFWTRGDGTHAGRFGIYNWTGGGDIKALAGTGVIGTTYVQVDATFIAPVGCVLVRINLVCPSINGGICYFDDVSVGEAIATPTSPGRINLLDPNGIMLKDWVPVEGGHDSTYVESSLGDYGQVIFYRETDVDEKLVLVIKRTDQDSVIKMGQDLRRMLRTALNYWTDSWRGDFVYIQARAKDETNTRYAIIKDGEIPKDNNPFALPFASCNPITDNFELFITRGPWLDDVPGTATAIELSAIQTYDGRTVGNVDSTETRDPTTNANEVFVGNKQNVAQITDIWWWDNSALAWSVAGTVPPTGNIMDAALPVAFMPPTPLQVDDFVLFGIDTSLDDSGPFCSLVFDIGTKVGGGGITIEWRYRGAGDTVDPSTWTAIDVQDNINQDGAMTGDAFDTTGVHSVHWLQPNDWETANPQVGANPALGVTGYWIAAYVTAAAGAPAPPTQQNRDIYTITWGYTEVQSTEIEGDIPALLKVKIRDQGDHNGTGAMAIDPCLTSTRLLIGARSVERGADFGAYLNCATEQNPTGVTVTASGGFTANTSSPTGWIWQRVATNILTSNRCVWTIDANQAAQYFGRYHLFVRGILSDHTIDHAVRGGVSFGYYGGLFYTDLAYFTYSSTDIHESELIDLGQIILPPSSAFASTETVGDLAVRIEIKGDSAKTFRIIDVIILPVDEWAIDMPSAAALYNRGSQLYNTYAIVDAVEYPKYQMRTSLYHSIDDQVVTTIPYATNNPANIKSGRRQRLWFVRQLGPPFAAFQYGGRAECASTVQAWIQQRYLSMRGDR